MRPQSYAFVIDTYHRNSFDFFTTEDTSQPGRNQKGPGLSGNSKSELSSLRSQLIGVMGYWNNAGMGRRPSDK